MDGALELGRVVAGRYRLDALLGAGGMGVVAQARDLRLDRDVALKLLPPELVGDAQARARLLREARAMAAFVHPHVAHVYDVGETDDGGAYLAMELVAGETVRRKLATAWPVDERVRTLLDVARALDAAHRAHLVHRDVKPDNLMVRTDGRAVLLDFGIVRVARGPETEARLSTLTGPDAIVGTLAYMSPEQSFAAEIDGRSDQFAFGVTAFEVLTGAYPWPGATQAAALAALLTQPTPAASERAPVPPAVDAVLARATAKEPGARYPSMDALAAALEAAVGSLATAPVTAAPAPPGGASDALAPTAAATPRLTGGAVARSASFPAAVAPPDRRRKARLAVGGVTLGAAVVAGVLVVASSAPPGADDATGLAAPAAHDTDAVTARSSSAPSASTPSTGPASTTTAPPPASAVALVSASAAASTRSTPHVSAAVRTTASTVAAPGGARESPSSAPSTAPSAAAPPPTGIVTEVPF